MTHAFVRGDACRLPLPDRSVDFVFGSPPYTDSRLYLEDGRDLGIARGIEEWVEWMLRVTAECLRVSRGAVVWVAAGKTEDRNYWPACEGLMWEWWRRGGHAYRPCYWHRSGIPGNGGDDWFRADVEYVMCFKRQGKLTWADNTAMGHPPRYGPGGPPSYRLSDGSRVTGKGHWKRGRRANGNGVGNESTWMSNTVKVLPEIANPGNLISTGAGGGGNLGSDYAHANEAPFPEKLAEFFVRSLCPPGGTVLDPFSGSGTTVAVADGHGRRGIGIDLRDSQCLLGMRRLERPHAPVPKTSNRGDAVLPLFASMEDSPL